MLIPGEAKQEAIDDCGLSHLAFVPESAAQEKRPLVLLMHGRSGTAQAPWIFSKAFQSFKPVTISPQGFLSDPLGGFSWWPVAGRNVKSDLPPDPEPVLEAVRRLRHFISRLPQWYPVGLERMCGVGFSQGGALLSSLSLLEPGLFRGVAILSGFVPRAVVPLLPPGAAAGKNPARYFVVHGTKDQVIAPEHAKLTEQILREQGYEVQLYLDEAAHKVSAYGMKALENWFTELLGS